MHDKVLPEFGNQKFVDYRIKLKDALAKVKQFSSDDVMKYLKAVINCNGGVFF